MAQAPEPGYVLLHKSGDLLERAGRLGERLAACDLCPRACGVDRTKGDVGYCGQGARLKVSSYNPHFGEEAPLVGIGGSGTIFLTGCNLKCNFCQNYEISHLGLGREVSVERMAGMMLELQGLGCHNVNLVTPTHFTPQIIEALDLAAGEGLDLPLAYNCGGYESAEALRALEGVVDIYMPDAKFWDPDVAARFAGARDYPDVMTSAIKEMHRQVGDLVVEGVEVHDGGRTYLVELAVRGLLVRHLVLPNGLAGTGGVAGFMATEVSMETYINVMEQYRPCHEAVGDPGMGRRLTKKEFDDAVMTIKRAGLFRLDGGL